MLLTMKLRNGHFAPVPRGLPQACRWIDDGAGAASYLHYHFASIGAAHGDGRFRVSGWGLRPPIEGKAASFRQAKHFVTRLVEVRGIPFKHRTKGHPGHDPALLHALLHMRRPGRALV